VNKQELIASGLLETYVLGLCTAEETALVTTMCQQFPELLIEIEAIEESLITAAAINVTAPKAAIKQSLFAELGLEQKNTAAPEAQFRRLPKENDSRLKLYRFGMAASLVLFVTSLAYNYLLNQKLNSLHSELAQINASKSVMADQMQIQQTKLSSLDHQLHIIGNPKVETILLAGMNSIDKSSAVVRWNAETKEVFFEASHLPAVPKGKQYQLWAIVKGVPVDAGTVDLNSIENVFQKMKTIAEAEAFAVTIEKTGGSASPSLETICLMGKI
jgi:anti-sigma-K factor RskA